MGFQILNNNGQALTMDELNKEAAAFWNVEPSDHYAAPIGFHWSSNWFQHVGRAIAQMPKGECEWADIIGYLCSIAAIGETSFLVVLDFIKCYAPFIKLCLYWKAKGYTPISC